MSLAALLLALVPNDVAPFVHWETPHVTPLALTPDGARLIACNTPDARIEVFDATGPELVHLYDVPVGIDPVSVRARTDDEVWVVNHLSDSLSVVSLQGRSVVRTLATEDEPCDVVFAGTPERAFVTCSQANRLLVFDPQASGGPLAALTLEGEEPRALAASPDGSRVYVAFFESGNATTVLAGGINSNLPYPPNVVNDPAGPWGGTNPPPNSGAGFAPAQNPQNPPPPRVSLIVRKRSDGSWTDDNGGDWTSFVTGPDAPSSGRPVGWDLPDHDVAIVDAQTFAVSYASSIATMVMALGVDPSSGDVAVVGTDARNEVRYEPVLNGVFSTVGWARLGAAGQALAATDLNPHLDYQAPSVPQALRDRSLGDPRGVAWRADGSAAFVTGMGSNNLLVVDASGARVGQAPTIEVGEGPTGVVVHEASLRAFCLNKFESSVSVVSLRTETEVQRLAFHDPSPDAVRRGRRHFYGTHETSGPGHLSCATCHVDGRTDRLCWDLGDPAGEMRPFDQNCPDGTCADWHPMKGPMLTQTFQDIIGHEPLHWRGDRHGLEEFNGAFESLLGDDEQLTATEMAEFEAFVATIALPPNPFRNLDNTLSDSVPLDGFFTSGYVGPGGLPLGGATRTGDAQAGLALWLPPNMLDGVACVTCHTLPTGMGTDLTLSADLTFYEETPLGPNGESHHAIVGTDGATNRSIKTPQLRTLYERIGFEAFTLENTSGFGYFHDGSFDSLPRFVSSFFNPFLTDDQQVADLTAFLLSFSGSDLPTGDPFDLLQPLGPTSLDTHAAVGAQVTLAGSAPVPLTRFAELLALADSGAVGLIGKGRFGGLARGFRYDGSDLWQTDRRSELVATAALLQAAAPGAELTFTVVPAGTETRRGIDRDSDGALDRDELDASSDPADPDLFPEPGVPFCFGDGGVAPGCTGCPCGNDAPVGTLGGCLNSAGRSARLVGDGAASVSGDTLAFRLENGGGATFAFLVSGENALPQGAQNPCSGLDSGVTSVVLDGLRCIGGDLIRHGARATDAAGDVGCTNPGWGGADAPLQGILAQGNFAVGTTRRFQVFYREFPDLACGTGSQTSSALEVAFLP